MIDFHYSTEFKLNNQDRTQQWIENTIEAYGCEVGELNYIFCDDEYLHKINLEYLNHDTYTDIISFDYTSGTVVSGDIYISIDRVKENAQELKESFDNELHRVIIHGVLHYLGQKDATEKEKLEMRNKENLALSELKN